MNLKEHCDRTKKRYNVTGEDIHRWMDEPVKIYGRSHRKFRHIVDNPPHFAIEKYGLDLAQNIIIDHILVDRMPTTRTQIESILEATEYAELFEVRGRLYELREYHKRCWNYTQFLIIKVKHGKDGSYRYGQVVYDGNAEFWFRTEWEEFFIEREVDDTLEEQGIKVTY